MSITSGTEPGQDAGQGNHEARPSRTRRSGAKPIEVASLGEWLPASELHLKLCSAFKAGKRISLDLEGLEHVDGGSLQLLLALSREASAVQLLNTSPSLCEWLHLAGAKSLIDSKASKPR